MLEYLGFYVSNGSRLLWSTVIQYTAVCCAPMYTNTASHLGNGMACVEGRHYRRQIVSGFELRLLQTAMGVAKTFNAGGMGGVDINRRNMFVVLLCHLAMVSRST